MAKLFAVFQPAITQKLVITLLSLSYFDKLKNRPKLAFTQKTVFCTFTFLIFIRLFTLISRLFFN